MRKQQIGDTAAHKVGAGLAASTNRFGFRLLKRQLDQSPGNVLLSPYSLAVALAMTYNGAMGETAYAMATTLGWQHTDVHQLNQAMSALQAVIGARNPRIELVAANALWAAENYRLKPDFVERNQALYDAALQNVDFGDPGTLELINSWVEERTDLKVQHLLRKTDLSPLTVLVLINALYFRGMWAIQFDEQLTVEARFTCLNGKRKRVPMMAQSGRFQYMENQTVRGISLPYGDGQVSMLVLLPRPDLSPLDLIQQLDGETWQRWASQFRKAEGEVMLPRFKLEYEVELSEALSAMGMAIAFTTRADLTGMGPGGLYISKVRHKTHIEVNEEGTEAAAATAVIITRGFSSPRFRMVVDRPFVCLIRDNRTGVILFVGLIAEPG